ncbi:hypothetical protein [Candidatus Chromulinivorax destructor]|uniref:Uncharacterized protein n=1 Tax=Candidatus Chromulinivorax destructor TaxID=2066483 RepID=A0A345ZCB4_9BACT|nr:hypothetical protein [Candidatus Chromulinivorax destructor]AXK60931.1 hypothetical protein C0J27_04315 [Candidatus Chromulinivorax destructor]
MKNSLFLAFSLLCISQLSLAYVESKNTEAYQTHFFMGCLKFNDNNENRKAADIFSQICDNQEELDAIRVLSKDVDIRLFMHNINLILLLEDLIHNNKESVGQDNVNILSFLTQSIKESYVDKLEDSKQF